MTKKDAALPFGFVQSKKRRRYARKKKKEGRLEASVTKRGEAKMRERDGCTRT